jgi:hypothetical protein
VQVVDHGARHPCLALGEVEASSSSSWRLASASSLSRACRWASATRSWLRFGPARCRGHTDVAFPRGVMLSCGPRPPSHRRPRGGIGRAEVVDVGRHWVIREARLSMGVHHGVPLHELPQASGSSPLAWKARSVR